MRVELARVLPGFLCYLVCLWAVVAHCNQGCCLPARQCQTEFHVVLMRCWCTHVSAQIGSSHVIIPRNQDKKEARQQAHTHIASTRDATATRQADNSTKSSAASAKPPPATTAAAAAAGSLQAASRHQGQGLRRCKLPAGWDTFKLCLGLSTGEH